MRSTTWTPLALVLSAALLAASCVEDGTPEGADTEGSVSDPTDPEPEPTEDRQTEATEAPEPPQDPDAHDYAPKGLEESERTIVVHLECINQKLLAEKAEHNVDTDQPYGWPQEWDGVSAMPNPLCHPDYLEVGEWDHLEEFEACCEGIQTENIVHDGTRSQGLLHVDLWEQSLARAQWEPRP